MTHLSEKDMKATHSFYIYLLSFRFKIFSSMVTAKKTRMLNCTSALLKSSFIVLLVYKRKEVPYT